MLFLNFKYNMVREGMKKLCRYGFRADSSCNLYLAVYLKY